MAHVLTVCTGNICRSPAAAVLLSGYLGPAVSVGSAGTRAVVGAPIDPPMLVALEGQAGWASGMGDNHRAVQLTPTLVEGADLVVGLTRAHRDAAVVAFPLAMTYAVTLDELAVIARLGLELPGDDLDARLRNAGAVVARNRHVIAREGSIDIPDPYRESPAVYAQAAALIADRVAVVASWLRGA